MESSTGCIFQDLLVILAYSSLVAAKGKIDQPPTQCCPGGELQRTGAGFRESASLDSAPSIAAEPLATGWLCYSCSCSRRHCSCEDLQGPFVKRDRGPGRAHLTLATIQWHMSVCTSYILCSGWSLGHDTMAHAKVPVIESCQQHPTQERTGISVHIQYLPELFCKIFLGRV